MVSESYRQHDKSIEWSKFLQAKFPTPTPPSPSFNAIWKIMPQLWLVFLFTPSLFHFKLYAFLELIKFNQFQISENKPDETPYVML